MSVMFTMFKKKISKRGISLNTSTVINALIGLVILFNVLALVIPEVNTAGDTLNATGAPFATFFQSNGLIVLAIMAATVVIVVSSVMKKKSGR